MFPLEAIHSLELGKVESALGFLDVGIHFVVLIFFNQILAFLIRHLVLVSNLVMVSKLVMV